MQFLRQELKSKEEILKSITRKSMFCSSDHMFGRAIEDNLPKCIFENLDIARVKRGKTN